MEQRDRNTILIAHKPSVVDVQIYRALNPDWNNGPIMAYQPDGHRRQFNPSKYSSRALLTIEELMKKGTQSDVALKIMASASQSDVAMRIAMNSTYGADFGERGNIHDINEDRHLDAFKGVDANMLFTGKKKYVKEITVGIDAVKFINNSLKDAIKPVERNDIKGAYMGVCNMSSCKSGEPASWYNYGSLNYYCPGCAKRLSNDPFNKKDAFRLFGHDLCLEGPEITKE